MVSPRTQRLRIAAVALTFAAVAGCSAGGSTSDGARGHAATGLPTTPPAGAPLLCGIVPRPSVATAVDEPAGTLRTTGRLDTDRKTGHVKGRCAVTTSSGSQPALLVEVLWPSTTQAASVRSLIGTGTPYTFPSSYAPGIGYYNGPGTDVASQAVASVVWGDYVVSVTDNAPGTGRDPLEDSVGLVHQVVAALHLPKPASSS